MLLYTIIQLGWYKLSLLLEISIVKYINKSNIPFSRY